MIIKVPQEDLHIVWNEVEPLIKKALDDTYTARDILDGLVKNAFQLFTNFSKYLATWSNSRFTFLFSAILTDSCISFYLTS